MSKPPKGGRLFRVSRPYGYYMEDVEAAIEKYNKVFAKLRQAIVSRDKIIEKRDEELMAVRGEVQRMQLEMSMLELPDMNHVQEQIILNQFTDQKTKGSPTSEFEPKQPEPIEEALLDLPIIGSEENQKPIDISKNIGFEIIE